MADWTLGGGYVYSDIVLRDKNGNPITHDDITRIDVAMADGRIQPYYDMGALKSYLLAPSSDGYVVTGGNPPGFSYGMANHGIVQILTESMLNEYGGVSGSGDNQKMTMYVVYTLKNLEIGKTYSLDYLLNQGGE